MRNILICLAGVWAFIAASGAPLINGLSSTRVVVAPGQSALLTVTATGSGSLTYQWRHNGRMMAGATGAGFSLFPVVYQDTGYYFVDVTDNTGTTRSAPIFVTVAPTVTQVRGWGSNSQGQIYVPAGLTDAIAIAGGAEHSVALKRNGTVIAWGSSLAGQINVPADLANVVAVSTAGANGNHTLALKSDGTVVAWGSDDHGETDVPTGLVDVVAIAAARFYSMALKSDGTVIEWGC